MEYHWNQMDNDTKQLVGLNSFLTYLNFNIIFNIQTKCETEFQTNCNCHWNINMGVIYFVDRKKWFDIKLTRNIWGLKLHCGYKYTRPCMISRIWGLKQLWLQVNGHAWFHLHWLRWAVRNGEGVNNSKWKQICLQRDSSPCPALHDR